MISSTGRINITQYDDYLVANGRQFTWTSSTGAWNGGDLGTGTIRAEFKHRRAGTVLSRTGAIVSGTAPQSVRLEMPSTFTGQFQPGQIYYYQIRCQTIGDRLETLETGELIVNDSILGGAT